MGILSKAKKLPIHPFLFAVSPILFFFSYNKTELSILDRDFLIALALSLSLSFLVWMVLKLIIKSGEKAAIITSLSIVLFFTYGHIESLLTDFLPKQLTDFGPDKIMFSAWGIIFLAGSYLVIKTKKEMRKLGAFLTIVAASSILLSLVNIIPYEITNALANRQVKDGGTNPQEEIVTHDQKDTSKLPDIYYLIFDRYGNKTSLKNYLNFDNSEFLNYLDGQGFFVANESFANYPRTFNSLASSLNMEYLDQLTKQYGEEYSSVTPLYNMIENNRVVQFLKGIGYEYVHISSWYPATKRNKNADVAFNYQTGIQSNFLEKLIEDTMLEPILNKFFREDASRESSRRGTLYEFARLSDAVSIKGPKFVFAHFLIPHDPYVLDQDGNPITQEQVDKIGTKAAYVNQLIFVNKKIKELIQEIKDTSENPPVIVIQSDEGPFTAEWSKSAGPEDLRQISDAGLKNHIRIFNTYYLPKVDTDKVLYPGITPVNTFRTIFNLYLGTNLKILKDRAYIFQDDKHLFKFIDVTDKVNFD